LLLITIRFREIITWEMADELVCVIALIVPKMLLHCLCCTI